MIEKQYAQSCHDKPRRGMDEMSFMALHDVSETVDLTEVQDFLGPETTFQMNYILRCSDFRIHPAVKTQSRSFYCGVLYSEGAYQDHLEQLSWHGLLTTTFGMSFIHFLRITCLFSGPF